MSLKTKIVIVDDSADFLQKMKTAMESGGVSGIFTVQISRKPEGPADFQTSNLEAAVAKIKELDPEVVFLDHNFNMNHLGLRGTGFMVAHLLEWPKEKLVCTSPEMTIYCGRHFEHKLGLPSAQARNALVEMVGPNFWPE